MDIDIFKNDHVDIKINIFQIVLIDIDIFKISLLISIFSKNAYRYFVDINILTTCVKAFAFLSPNKGPFEAQYKRQALLFEI